MRARQMSNLFLLLEVVLFFGGLLNGPVWKQLLTGFAVWFVLVALTIVIRNTTPRLRIDQAVRFFWGPVSVVALLAAALAWLGW